MDNNYTIYDNNPSAGTNYYQLIQYDIDGKATYYGIRTVILNLSKVANIKIYPNPLSDHLGILLNDYAGKSIKVNLFDINGGIIMRQEMATSTGRSYYQLKLNTKLSAGHYIRVHGDGLEQSFKVAIR